MVKSCNITVYGHKLDNKNIRYYHGLNGAFMFLSLRKDFNIPTSVTTSLIAAQNFAGYNGIILQLQCQWNYKSKWNLSSALSVEWMTAFPDKKEVLLFGNFNQLIIHNIFFMNNINNNYKHKLIIQAINNFEQLCDGYSLDPMYDDKQHANDMGILIEAEIQCQHYIGSYFLTLFHNICVNRKYFVRKAFTKHLCKWPNIYEVFGQGSDDNICCDKCDAKLIQPDRGNYRCSDCNEWGVSWKCEKTADCTFWLYVQNVLI